MTSEVGRLIQDLNLDDHSNGTFVVGEGDVLKRGFGGSKVDGDLSKCGKPSMTVASQKQPSVADDFNSKREGGAVIEEVIADEDIVDDDFAYKPVARRTRIDIDDIPEEEFLEMMLYEHDHYKYIESQKKASNLFHAAENKVEDRPLDWDLEEFDGSEMLEALESMNESEFMEALESLDESEFMEAFKPMKEVTRPTTWIPKCPDTLSSKCVTYSNYGF